MFARTCVLLLALSVTACSARFGPLDSVLSLTQTSVFNSLPSWISSAFEVPKQANNVIQFEAWKKEHGKTYGSEGEHKEKFQVYQVRHPAFRPC
jgi:hypothetical protein